MIVSALIAASQHGSKSKPKSFNVIVNRLFYTDHGQILISAIFGIAFAFLFQKVCKGDKCIIIDAPDPEEIKNTVYELEGVCYKYKPRSVECKALVQ